MTMDNNNTKFSCPYAGMQPCSTMFNDETAFLDVWHALWERRILILTVTVLVTVMASGYAFLTPKIYDAKVTIAPFPNLEIGMLSMKEGEKPLDPAMAFDIVLRKLQKSSVKAKFFTEGKIASPLMPGDNTQQINLSISWFMKNLSFVSSPAVQGEDKQATLTLSGENPDVITKVLNNFIIYIDDYSQRAIIKSLKSKLEKDKLALAKRIETLRWNARVNIKAQIVKLLEQKAIAEKLKIIEMPTKWGAGVPGYARGVKALNAEINTLRQRKNILFFVPGLKALQKHLKTLDKINLDKVQIHTLQAGTTLVVRKPPKPAPELIVKLGIIAGLMLGIFLAFFANYLHQINPKKS